MNMTAPFPRLLLTGSALLLIAPFGIRAQTTSELDAYWDEVSRTVAAGDFEGYSNLYHPDAVLVDLGSGTSYPIADALDRWKAGFYDTRAGKAKSSVSFRLTQRFHDGATAHETGMFRYMLEPEGGAATGAIVHFEGLLVKKGGVWLMVMEYQKQAATEAEWRAAGGR